MPVEIKVPRPGESVTEGVVQWLKPDGASVRADEPILEFLSDKAALEVKAPVAGVLKARVAEGATVPVESVVAVIAEGPAPAADKAPAKAAAKSAPDRAVTPSKPKANEQPAPSADEVRLAPSARNLVAEHNLDAARIPGSGRGGLVTKEDVLAHLESRTAPPGPRPAKPEPPTAPVVPPPAPAAPPAAGPRETRQRMTPLRQTIAKRLLSAQQNAAILTTFNEADMSAIMALRTKYKENFQKKHGVGLGFMSFFVKAVVEALRAYPAVNAFIDGNDLVFHHYCNVGVAVSTDKGLMVPVLRDVQRMSFAEIEKGIAAMAAKAREGKIAVSDLEGGTFTITNGGVFGSLLSTPILNAPQSAILGMHAIQKRPVVVEDQVVVRPMMYLALSYDHRIIDGREAVSFLVRVKECVEDPERLLLDV
jgi:2-oxoglutarate dehydrogenase E2 component (dihydrolipoamide succinyltransferase)